MANMLKMAVVQAIQQLLSAGWSQRRIARELGIDRGTVARYVQSLHVDPNAAISPAGSAESNAATFPGLPAPAAHQSGGSEETDSAGGLKPAISPAGSEGPKDAPPTCEGASSSARGAGRPSDCEPFQELILAKLDQGLSAQRIYQDLVSDHGATVSYDSVKRFVRRLRPSTPLPFPREADAPSSDRAVAKPEGVSSDAPPVIRSLFLPPFSSGESP